MEAGFVTSDELKRPRVNTSQAATIAGVHPNTIYNWVRSNKIEYAITPTGQLRIFADSLLVRQPD